MARHERESHLYYTLDEFKQLLDIESSYRDFRNLKKRVLTVVVDEINQKTSVEVKMDLRRKGRKVIGVDFFFWDKERMVEKTTPSAVTTKSMTFSQLKAYELLTEYGVKKGIVMKQILPRIGGSEAEGFEDMWVEECLVIFRKKARGGVGAFVNWFLKLEVFDQGEHFAEIMERLQQRKKKLQRERPDAWENRLEARRMTAEEFRESRLG